MGLFKLEHSKAAYVADFVAYGVAVVALAAYLLLAGPREQRLELWTLAAVGLAGWTGIEYALHRFILHGMQPFRRWHAEHHQRPTALVSTPTVFSAALIAALVFLPILALTSLWPACAVTLGVLTGYLAYAVMHHATHHWRADSAWLKQRKRWHALHHRATPKPGCYGVTSAFWDHVFGTTPGQPSRRPVDEALTDA